MLSVGNYALAGEGAIGKSPILSLEIPERAIRQVGYRRQEGGIASKIPGVKHDTGPDRDLLRSA